MCYYKWATIYLCCVLFSLVFYSSWVIFVVITFDLSSDHLFFIHFFHFISLVTSFLLLFNLMIVWFYRMWNVWQEMREIWQFQGLLLWRFGLVVRSLCRSDEVCAFKRARLRLFNRLNVHLLTGSLDRIFLTWRSVTHLLHPMTWW